MNYNINLDITLDSKSAKH